MTHPYAPYYLLSDTPFPPVRRGIHYDWTPTTLSDLPEFDDDLPLTREVATHEFGLSPDFFPSRETE